MAKDTGKSFYLYYNNVSEKYFLKEPKQINFENIPHFVGYINNLIMQGELRKKRKINFICYVNDNDFENIKKGIESILLNPHFIKKQII